MPRTRSSPPTACLGALLACFAAGTNGEEVVPHPSQYCAAKATIDYLQRNIVASVDGKIENTYCGASSGSYDIRLRVRGDDGELQEFTYAETWQRDDDLTIEFHHDYEIPENVDLLNVRIRRLRCLCADIPNLEQESPAAAGTGGEQ